jgi:hypothetical protein
MNLGFLDLSYNKLGQIELDAFKGLTKLTVMWLSDNMLILNNICRIVFKNVKAIQNLRLNTNYYTTDANIYGEIVENLPELCRFELDVVTDYKFEKEFAYLKQLSELKIYSQSNEGFYFRKSTFTHLPLSQITSLILIGVYNIDNDTFSNLTNINSLEIGMGRNYHQKTIIRTFESLDAFRDTNMTQLDIHSNRFETSFILNGSMLQYVQRICLKHFTLGSMYSTDINTQALTTFANYSRCLESLEISDNIIFDPRLVIMTAICISRNLRSFVYSDNNRRIGHIKDETRYVKYDVNNTDMNTIQRFGISVHACIPKTLTTLFLKDSKATLYGFSFVGGNNLQKLSFLLRLNECSFQILGVENLKYLDMTGWYCNKVSGHLLSKLFLLETLIASDVHLGDGLKNHSEAAFLLQNNLNLKHIDFS